MTLLELRRRMAQGVLGGARARTELVERPRR